MVFFLRPWQGFWKTGVILNNPNNFIKSVSLLEVSQEATIMMYANKLFKPMHIFSLLLCLSCSSIETDWSNAEKKDTVEAYESFLNKYPNSEFSVKANQIIAEKKNTVEAYTHFLTMYPNSDFSIRAKQKVVELMWGDFKGESIIQGTITDVYEIFQVKKSKLEPIGISLKISGHEKKSIILMGAVLKKFLYYNIIVYKNYNILRDKFLIGKEVIVECYPNPMKENEFIIYKLKYTTFK
jgi:hypothetical protein